MLRRLSFLLIVMVLSCTPNSGDPAADRGDLERQTAFVAGLSAEIHTGAPFFTRLVDFEESDDSLFRSTAETRGWDIVAGKFLGAAPANRVLRGAYETIIGDLLADLRAAMPVDMVVLALHGAMVAQGNDDIEGDVLSAVREIVGPDVPIGAGLDAHAHLSQAMMDAADILVFYKEWPHIDANETQVRAFELTADVAEGKIEPHMAMYDPQMIAMYHTLDEPVRSVVDEMIAAERDSDVVVVDFVHGFGYADVPDMGTKILVITDNAPEKGRSLAERFGRQIFELRGRTAAPTMDLEEGLDAIVASTDHPTVIADYSDMPFGGAPGDGTIILKGLIDRGIENAIIAGLWDPMAIDMVEDLEAGDRMNLRIGGKTGPMSGDPLDLDVEVRSIHKNMYLKSGYEEVGSDGDGTAVGTIAVVQAHGIDIVLVDKRYPIYGYRALESLGLDPAGRRAIVIKSGNNFYDGYADIAGDVVYVISAGLLGRIRDQIFHNIDRPKWPFDEPPFG